MYKKNSLIKPITSFCGNTIFFDIRKAYSVPSMTRQHSMQLANCRDLI